jgi:hypothetical protein
MAFIRGANKKIKEIQKMGRKFSKVKNPKVKNG